MGGVMEANGEWGVESNDDVDDPGEWWVYKWNKLNVVICERSLSLQLFNLGQVLPFALIQSDQLFFSCVTIIILSVYTL